MGKNNTMLVRAPKDLVHNWRIKYPGCRDAELIRIMWNSSLLRLDAGLITEKKRRKDEKFY